MFLKILTSFTMLGALAFVLVASRASAQQLSWSFFQVNSDSNYKDEGEAVMMQFQMPNLSEHHLVLGYTYTGRDYTEGTKFKKNNFSFGDTWVLLPCACYFEATLDYAGATPVGATAMYGVAPHTTYFSNWDFGFGFKNASYQAGNIFITNPQILYMSELGWTLGHGSWVFNKNGTHYSWRNLVRYTGPEKLKLEAAISGGESYEDSGVIDRFNAYGVVVGKNWNNFGINATFEHYDGQARDGNSYQLDLLMQW